MPKNRKENPPRTVEAHGDVKNYKSGMPKELKQYADATAGEIVNGVIMAEFKKMILIILAGRY